MPLDELADCQVMRGKIRVFHAFKLAGLGWRMPEGLRNLAVMQQAAVAGRLPAQAGLACRRRHSHFAGRAPRNCMHH
jgi:hypothetical protein